ncbi:PREDICTED: uncharacterized protein LOC101297310, partial [Fragaria vesca subsp. vesca]
MASLSTLYLIKNPSPLRFFTSKASSPCLGFGSQIHLKPNEIRFPACRVYSKMVFPTLQADDFRHPVDLEGVRRYMPQPDSSAEMGVAAEDVVARYLAVGAFPSEKIEDDGTSVLAGPTQ